MNLTESQIITKHLKITYFYCYNKFEKKSQSYIFLRKMSRVISSNKYVTLVPKRVMILRPIIICIHTSTHRLGSHVHRVREKKEIIKAKKRCKRKKERGIETRTLHPGEGEIDVGVGRESPSVSRHALVSRTSTELPTRFAFSYSFIQPRPGSAALDAGALARRSESAASLLAPCRTVWSTSLGSPLRATIV